MKDAEKLSLNEEEDIKGVIEKFTGWRKGKRSIKDRIPEELWNQAVELAEKYSVYRVSRELGLSYMDLKGRMKAGKKRDIPLKRSSFIELSVRGGDFGSLRGSSSECMMEMVRGDGTQLRIYSAIGVKIDITRICENFLRG